MEFFKLVAEKLQDGQQINMAIRKKGDSLVVSIMVDNKSVKDAAFAKLEPQVMSGTPEEFEQDFPEVFGVVSKALGLEAEIREYEESVENARKQSDMVAKQKEAEKKEKDNFKSLLDKVKKLKDEHKFADAKSVLAKASTSPQADKKAIDKLSKDIDLESGAGSLFGGVEDVSDGKAIESLSPASVEEDETEEDEDDNDNDMED